MHLYDTIDRLSVRDRTIYVLRYIEGLEQAEISAAIGLSISTVRRRLERLTKRVTSLMNSDPVLSQYLARSRGQRDAGAPVPKRHHPPLTAGAKRAHRSAAPDAVSMAGVRPVGVSSGERPPESLQIIGQKVHAFSHFTRTLRCSSRCPRGRARPLGPAAREAGRRDAAHGGGARAAAAADRRSNTGTPSASCSASGTWAPTCRSTRGPRASSATPSPRSPSCTSRSTAARRRWSRGPPPSGWATCCPVRRDARSRTSAGAPPASSSASAVGPTGGR